jgi:CBS domain-containing protein
MSLKLEDVMVEDVITVEEKATIKKAVELMNKHEIGCLIVVKRGKPAGIVTERDMLKRILLESRDPEKIKVNEIMSKPLIVGKPQMDIEDAVKLMFKRNIKKLPVTEKGHLVGLVTLTDLVRSEQIINMLKELPAKETPKRMKKVVDYFNRIISISYE